MNHQENDSSCKSIDIQRFEEAFAAIGRAIGEAVQLVADLAQNIIDFYENSGIRELLEIIGAEKTRGRKQAAYTRREIPPKKILPRHVAPFRKITPYVRTNC